MIQHQFVFVRHTGRQQVGFVHGSSGQKATRKFNIVGVRKTSGQRRRKSGVGCKRAVPGRAISTLPPRRGGAPTPVLSPARRSAAVRMGRDVTARPPEAEWSSGVAAVWGGVIKTKISSKQKKTPLPRRWRIRLDYTIRNKGYYTTTNQCCKTHK